jgi:hypothetical protein
MATSKHNLKVDAPTCGHNAGIQAAMNPNTGEWLGRCPQCGAPAKVEMQIETPSGMKALSRRKFGEGNRVIVGINREPGTVKAVRDQPGPLGEYVHEVLIDGAVGLRTVLGSEMEPIPIGFSS